MGINGGKDLMSCLFNKASSFYGIPD